MRLVCLHELENSGNGKRWMKRVEVQLRGRMLRQFGVLPCWRGELRAIAFEFGTKLGSCQTCCDHAGRYLEDAGLGESNHSDVCVDRLNIKLALTW
jgi:hypothetical protein